MNYSIFLFLLGELLCFQFSLYGKEINGENTDNISGRFINKTYLEKTASKLPGTIPVYCFEMNFTGNDSVNILYGFEESKLAYKKNGNNYVLVKAFQNKDMIFTLNDDLTITLIDSVWTGIPENSEFVKADDIGNKKWVFDNYLNEFMIAGNYILYLNNKPTEKKVTFSANGEVKGLEDYFKYEICYSGDCLEETDPPSNTITLEDRNNAKETYSFIIDRENHAITFYKIGEPIPDIKGNRSIQEKIFDIRK